MDVHYQRRSCRRSDRRSDRRSPQLASRRHAFSLLEVIIATAILAASAVMLMSLFATGDRHARRADERTMAQMLCHSKLDELLADPSQIIPIEANTFRQYPGWLWALHVQPTMVDGFVQLRVSVSRIPGMETGAMLDVASGTENVPSSSLPTSVMTSQLQPTYELVRWTRFDGDVSALSSATSAGATP